MTAKLLQPSLTGGELSPSLYGRVDIARYSTALKRCRNFIVRPTGGVENRPGFYLCWIAPAVPDDHRLIPFVFSTAISYVLFLGDGYMRFQFHGEDVVPDSEAYAGGTTYAKDAYVISAGITYRSLQAANTGHTPASSPSWWVADAGLQISIPWTVDQLEALRYTQSADVMYFAHPDEPQRELRRLTAGSFELRLFEAKDGPFADINSDESIRVAASGVLGTVNIASSTDIFTADHVGSLFYLESKNLGQIKPWVVADRDVVEGDLRRSDGKTYRATSVPSVGTWHETGPRQPIHENGRVWDGGGNTRSNGVDTWSSGIEWEFVDLGYGVVKITAVSDAKNATGEVTLRLPAQVVGGVGAAANTWTFPGTNSVGPYAIAGAGFGVYTVTIDGVLIQADPNYQPPGDSGGGIITDPCVEIGSCLPGLDKLAEDVEVGDELQLWDPVTGEPAVGKVTVARTEAAPLWRIVAACADGEQVSLVCSDSAPIPVPGGEYRFPPALMGARVPVFRPGRGVEWAPVCDLQRLGLGQVRFITVGDRCFWAGEYASGFILHHNAKQAPGGWGPI